MLFSHGVGVGLDIGSKQIKIVKIKKRGSRIEPVLFGSIDTPPGAMEAGNIIDHGLLSQSINELVQQLKIRDSKVVAAVSGQQIYIRNLIMPYMKKNELREAVIYQASTFLPIPTDEAAMDVFPLRHFIDSEGKKTEVFFVAARKNQVNDLIAVCQASELSLQAIELEPLALYRVLVNKPYEGAVGILNIGASRSYIAIFTGTTLSSLRNLSLGCSAFVQGYNWGHQDRRRGLDDINLNEDSSYSYLLGDITTELSRTLEYYRMQNGDRRVERILITGGGSRIKGLTEYLSSALGYPVETAGLNNRVLMPSHLNQVQQREMIHDYPVALGLAARGVI